LALLILVSAAATVGSCACCFCCGPRPSARCGATERRGPQQKQQPSTEGVGRNNQSSSALRGSQFFRFGVLTIRNQLHSGLWPGHQGKRAPPQNGPGLFFPALPRLIALVGNEWAPGSLGKQPAAHFPSPCSAGYPGRSREWLRPRLFGGSPRQFSGAASRSGSGDEPGARHSPRIVQTCTAARPSFGGPDAKLVRGWREKARTVRCAPPRASA
jgi:hypothetical protein